MFLSDEHAIIISRLRKLRIQGETNIGQNGSRDAERPKRFEDNGVETVQVPCVVGLFC